MTQRLIIVGHGMAATRLTEALLAYKCGDIAITLIGEEPQLAYNRIQLSPVLGGEKPFAHTLLHPRQWYIDHGVTVLSGERVLAVDAARRHVTTTRRILEWDELVFATGSVPFIPPIPGVEQAHVHPFRAMADVEAILQQPGPVVVLGGGVLGVEAAAALRLNCDVVTV